MVELWVVRLVLWVVWLKCMKRSNNILFFCKNYLLIKRFRLVTSSPRKITLAEALHAVYFDTPIFGDHVLVIAELSICRITEKNNCSLKRDWRSYSSTRIINDKTLHLKKGILPVQLHSGGG